MNGNRLHALSLGSPQGASRRSKRTRRSIVTIGRRTEPVEVVRSVTVQRGIGEKLAHTQRAE